MLLGRHKKAEHFEVNQLLHMHTGFLRGASRSISACSIKGTAFHMTQTEAGIAPNHCSFYWCYQENVLIYANDVPSNIYELTMATLYTLG